METAHEMTGRLVNKIQYFAQKTLKINPYDDDDSIHDFWYHVSDDIGVKIIINNEQYGIDLWWKYRGEDVVESNLIQTMSVSERELVMPLTFEFVGGVGFVISEICFNAMVLIIDTLSDSKKKDTKIVQDIIIPKYCFDNFDNAFEEFIKPYKDMGHDEIKKNYPLVHGLALHWQQILIMYRKGNFD